MDNKADPRTTDWFLMSSPLPTIAMCLGYVYIVKVRPDSISKIVKFSYRFFQILGPKLMENRKPFKLRKILIFYNLFQVIFSAWLFNEAAMGGWLTGYNYRCQPVEPGAKGMRVSSEKTSFATFFSN
jgi:elongation of very long chain fatty acids protein 7